MAIKTTRINTGIYSFVLNGRKYEVEQFPDKTWLLFELVGSMESREYIRDFITKSDCLAWSAKYL